MSQTADGAWRRVELLGRGGNAEVWRAVDPVGREAALKIPKSELYPEATKCLRREHERLTELAHSNVVRSLGLVACEGTTALALEYLPGGDLVSLIGTPPRHWLAALRGVLAALLHLHDRGFCYGDLKARNVLFGADGSSRLVDFASVRPISARVPRGGTTSAYAPANTPRDGREADCFAFAALLFELASGRLPYGPAGARHVGEAPTLDHAVSPRAVPLVTAATAALTASGHTPGGLPSFADVIESAIAADT